MPEVVLLTNSPFAQSLPIERELPPGSRCVVIPSHLSREQVARRVLGFIQQTPLDVLIVDTFPRGLGGELAEVVPNVNCRKILVHRDLNPAYCATFNLDAFSKHYDCLLVPGESAPLDNQPHARRTAPWLMRDHDELLTPSEARSALRASGSKLPVILVLGCGRSEEIQGMKGLADELCERLLGQALIRFASPESKTGKSPNGLRSCGTLRLWPVLPILPGVTAVIGGGGYNSVNEARATKRRLIAISWPRMYDRQARRLTPSERVTDLADAADRVEEVLNALDPTDSRSVAPYENGVHEALAIIDAC